MHCSPDQRVVFAGLLALAFMTGCASTSSSTASAGWDGLARRQVAGLDEVYVRPDVKFDVYRTVMIDPVQIAFDKNWDPNRSQRDLSLRLSAADIQEIKDDMARNFREVLVEELTAGGTRSWSRRPPRRCASRHRWPTCTSMRRTCWRPGRCARTRWNRVR
jgi:hypothetical protein